MHNTVFGLKLAKRISCVAALLRSGGVLPHSWLGLFRLHPNKPGLKRRTPPERGWTLWSATVLGLILISCWASGSDAIASPPMPGSPPSVSPLQPKRGNEASRVTEKRPGNRYGVVVSVTRQPGRPIQQVVVRLKETQQEAITGGNSGGQLITVQNPILNNPARNVPLSPGARVLLHLQKSADGHWLYHIVDRDRTPAIFILGALFLLAVLLIGGSEVTRHTLLIALMMLGCQTTLFPLALHGELSLLWIGLTCFTFTSLAVFIYGLPGARSLSREQLVVMLGTFGGLAILAAILWIMGEITPLNGHSTEGLTALWERSPRMDYWSFFLSGALMGFQGLLFYLCWTLVQRRRDESGTDPGFRRRFEIIMLRGRRLLGPIMSSVGLLLLGLMMPMLLELYGTPTARFINLESSASVLIYAFAGGLTLILTVPLTALLSAWLTKPRSQ